MLPTGASYVSASLFEAFLRSEHAAGRHTVLILDEAQNLSEQMLEELRCFSNMNGEGCELLQIILVGQPELNQIIGARPRCCSLRSACPRNFTFPAMPSEAVASTSPTGSK